jgi:outer membrane protein assembly factor BamA
VRLLARHAVAAVLLWPRAVVAQEPNPDEPDTSNDAVRADPNVAPQAEPAEPETTSPAVPAPAVVPDRGSEPAAAAPPPAAPSRERSPDVVERSRAGVRYNLESIEISGNTRTRARVILRYLPFEIGDVIDVDDPAVELARYRLLGTGFFRDVHFSLRKGSQRGWVVLVIDVDERNTIIVSDLWMGLAAGADREGNVDTLYPYAGIDAAETNLAGTGITLGSAIGLGPDQYALRVRFLDPAFLGGRWMTSASLLYNSARDYFGASDVIVAPGTDRLGPNSAPVDYTRFGGAIGAGRDLSVATQLWLHYRLETIDASVPVAASHVRGGYREPVQFDILPGRSVLSTVRATLQLDSRDQPYLPTRGWLFSLTGEVSLGPTGSTYRYQKLDALASRWWRLPWHDHVLRLDLFAGAIAGEAPFFEQYYVGDFSDFLPNRVLELNFDRRPPPDLLQTAIGEVRYGQYAARVGLEYRVPLYRGRRSVFGIDFFGSAGAYAVASESDLTAPNRRYRGIERIPVDVTANFGFRMDTSAGGFVFAFSNVLGLLPVRGDGP